MPNSTITGNTTEEQQQPGDKQRFDWTQYVPQDWDSGVGDFQDVINKMNIDPRMFKSGESIAGRFGLGGGEYGEYFRPIDTDLLEASQRESWKEYEQFLTEDVNKSYQNRESQIRLGRESSMLSSRKTMSQLLKDSQQIGSRFAGSGARYQAMQENALDERRKNRIGAESASIDSSNAYLSQQKGLFGIENDILQRMSEAKSSIYDWLQGQQQTALQIKQMNLQG